MHSLRLLWAAHNEDAWQRRQKRFSLRLQLEKIEDMPEMLFIQHFRLNKRSFRKLCNDLKGHAGLKGSPEIPVEIKRVVRHNANSRILQSNLSLTAGSSFSYTGAAMVTYYVSTSKLTTKVSTVTNIENESSSIVCGAFAYVLKLSRLFGMAPLRFERHSKGFRISTSTAMSVYSYMLVTVVGSAALVGKILELNLDFDSHMQKSSKLSQMVSFYLVFLVVIMAIVGVVGAPKRMRNMLAYMNTIASVDKTISAQYTAAKERNLLLLTAFCLIFVATMIVHDIYYVWEKGWIVVVSQSSMYAAWYSVVILNLQFVFIAMSIRARFQAVNETLSLTTSHFSLKLENAVLPEILNIFAILSTSTRAVGERAQSAIVQKSVLAEPRLIVPPSIAVHKITLLRGRLCDILTIVDEGYGLPIIVMLLSILGYIIVTPYYIISQINDPESQDKVHSIISLSVWFLIYVTQLFVLVEPCHNTTKEAKNTKSLVSRMMMSSPASNSVYSRLELLFQQLLMETDSYEPMGMCTLSRSLVVSIFGAVTTYLVILVQFQNEG